MMTTDSRTELRLEHVKYKHINYGSGAGKLFLNETSFPPEDDLNHFKFGQAYTNWLTLMETVSDSIVEQGWNMHHKCMIADREFLILAQAWHIHNHILHTRFMVKPFVWDPMSFTYKKQF